MNKVNEVTNFVKRTGTGKVRYIKGLGQGDPIIFPYVNIFTITNILSKTPKKQRFSIRNSLSGLRAISFRRGGQKPTFMKLQGLENLNP